MSFLGRDGFVWWVGVVEDRIDPLFLGRCRVRILGWHTSDKSLLPTTGLPWAMPIQPLASAAQTGVGISPTGPVEGSWIFGFYRDGEDAQEPMMLGTMGGIPHELAELNVGFNDPRLDIDPAPIAVGPMQKPIKLLKKLIDAPRDPDYDNTSYGKGQKVILQNRGSQGSSEVISTYPDPRYLKEPTTPRLARGRESTAKNYQTKSGQFRPIDGPLYSKDVSRISSVRRAKDGRFDEPSLDFAARYPYNHVQQSESGHLLEIDDTPKHERLHWFHRSGSYTEMQPSGDIVIKSVGDRYNLTSHNEFQAVQNEKIATIGAGYELLVNESNTPNGDLYIKVGNRGNAIVKTRDGNIQLDAGTKQIEFRAGTMAATFTKDLITTTEQDMSVSARNFTQTVTGNTSFTSSGPIDLAGSPITLSSSSNMVSVIAQNMVQDISETSVENLQPIKSILPTSIYAKQINAVFGKIKLESIDAAASGGIEINTGLAGAASTMKFGLQGRIDLISLLGDIETTALKGDVKTTVTAGDYSVTTAKGDINHDAMTGAIEVKARASTIDLDGGGKVTLKSKTEILNDAAAISLKASTSVSLGREQASEAIILGNMFMAKYGIHFHATGTGPSGPVNNAGQFTTTLSRKVFGS